MEHGVDSVYTYNKAKVTGNEFATAYFNRLTVHTPSGTGENHYKYPLRLTSLLTQLITKVKLVSVRAHLLMYIFKWKILLTPCQLVYQVAEIRIFRSLSSSSKNLELS
jgi:hypothetical protein